LIKLPEEWDKKKEMVEVSSQSAIIDILKLDGHVIPGVLEITVLSAKSPFAAPFTERINN